MKFNNESKWKCSVMTGLLFFVLAHPRTYVLVQDLLNQTPLNMELTNKSGSTSMGVLLHAVVFTLILRYTMDL